MIITKVSQRSTNACMNEGITLPTLNMTVTSTNPNILPNKAICIDLDRIHQSMKTLPLPPRKPLGPIPKTSQNQTFKKKNSSCQNQPKPSKSLPKTHKGLPDLCSFLGPNPACLSHVHLPGHRAAPPSAAPGRRAPAAEPRGRRVGPRREELRKADGLRAGRAAGGDWKSGWSFGWVRGSKAVKKCKKC